MRICCIAVFTLTLGLAAGMRGSQPAAGQSVLASVDHLVYATPDLAKGIEKIETLLGVRPTPGGSHPGRGTRNALVALGPSSYLEIIGSDPEQAAPAQPRTFGIDHLTARRLAAWSAKGHDLDVLVREAASHGIRLGAVASGSRRRPDGVLLSWRFTDPLVVVGDGIVPFFIDWGSSPHPALTAARGATLVDFRSEHPDPPRVQRLLQQVQIDLPVAKGPAAALIAVIETARGRVELR